MKRFKEHLIENTKKLTTKKYSKTGKNIMLNGVSTGWGVEKVKGGWQLIGFEGETVGDVHKTLKQALGNSGLDWDDD